MGDRDIPSIRQQLLIVREQVEHMNACIYNLHKQVKKLELLLNKTGNADFHVGDKLQIVNNYKGQKGIEGRFTEKKGLFYFIKDENNIVYKRVRKNLKIVERVIEVIESDGDSSSIESSEGDYE